MPTIYNDNIGAVLRSVNGDIQPQNPQGSNVSANANAGGINGQIQFNNQGILDGVPFSFYNTNSAIHTLGSNSNISISGGNLGQVLTTDGYGALSWTQPATLLDSPYIHIVVANAGNNQSFTDTRFTNFSNASTMNIMKDGVYLIPEIDFVKPTNDTITVNVLLAANTTLDVLARTGGTTGSGAYSNANVAAYLPNYGGNVAGNNLTFTSGDFAGNVFVGGNLTVLGNLNYAQVQSSFLEAPLFDLGTGPNLRQLITPDGFDRGLVLHTYGNGRQRFNTSLALAGNTTLTVDSTANINIGDLVYGNLANGTRIFTTTTVVTAIDTGNLTITVNQPLLQDAQTNTVLTFGWDSYHFMGWDTGNSEFALGSNVSVTNQVIGYNQFGNLRLNNVLGNIIGNTGNFANSMTTVNATFTGSNITFGNIETIHIGNGTQNSFITTDGNGNLSFAFPLTANLQYQDSGIQLAGALSNNSNTINVAGNLTNVFSIGSTFRFTKTNTRIYTVATANFTGPNTTITFTPNSNAAVSSLSNIFTVTTGNVNRITVGANVIANLVNNNLTFDSVAGRPALVEFNITGNTVGGSLREQIYNLQFSAGYVSNAQNLTATTRTFNVTSSTIYQAGSYGNGNFILPPFTVSGGEFANTAIRSTNGTTWSNVTLPQNVTSYGSAFDSGTNRHVILDTKGNSLSTSDFTTYTTQTLTQPPGFGGNPDYYLGDQWTSIKYLNGSIKVLFSSPANYNRSVCFFYESTDGGQTWNLWSALPAPAYYSDIAYGAGNYVVLTSSRSISSFAAYVIPETSLFAAYSVSLPVFTTWSSVAYGGPVGLQRFIVVGARAAAFSVDGNTWQLITNLPTTEIYLSVTYSNNKWVVASSTNFWYSYDGINWFNKSTNAQVVSFIDSGSKLLGIDGFRQGQYQDLGYTTIGTNYRVDLPASNLYSAQNFTWQALTSSGSQPQDFANSLAANILAIRPTYQSQTYANGLAVIDTNTTNANSNINITPIVNPSVGSLTFNTNYIYSTQDQITLTDPVNSQTFTYTVPITDTTANIVNEIAYQENLTNWKCYVTTTAREGSKLIAEAINSGYVPNTSLLVANITSGSNSNIVVANTTITNGT